MIKPFPEQTQISIDQIRWFGTLFIALLCFVSCRQPSAPEVKVIPVKHKVTGDNQKTDLAPPQVVAITAANRPKTIKAGRPVIKIDPSDGGIPFFTNYGAEQGLSQGTVICSAKDRYGNLWFGTVGGGVCRYDGKSFVSYTIANGLASNVVFCIFEDRTGDLWFGTTSGASRYDGYRFTNYTTMQGLAGNYVDCILQDSRGYVWLGTKDGLSKFDGEKFITYNKGQGLADNYVNCMLRDKRGVLWVGSAGGLSRYDGHRFINYNNSAGLPYDAVNCLSEDTNGDLWLGNKTGISKYDGRRFINFTSKQGLAPAEVSCMARDRDGNFWFGTKTAGISKYDGRKFTSYTKSQGLPDNNVSSIIQDKDGNLWFTSLGGGVTKYEGNSITHFTESQGFTGNLLNNIIQDKAGNLWMAPFDAGVLKYDGRTFTNYTTAQGLADNVVWMIFQDHAGNLWFGTEKGGATKFDGRTFTNYTTAQGLASNTVVNIMEDKDNNMWFGTIKGACRFDGKSFTNYTTAQGLADNNVQTIIQDRADNMWFGTHDDGASKYDGEHFTTYNTASGLISNTIYNMIQDQNGLIWFGTKNGASCFDGKKFTNYSATQGFTDHYFWALMEDKKRNKIWFATNQGLSALTRPANTVENFDLSTGYPIGEVNTCAMIVDRQGIVWAGGGRNKLIRFNYSAIHKKPSGALKLSLKGIKVNNESICWNNLLSSGVNTADSLSMLNEMVSSFGKVLTGKVLDSMRKKYGGIRFDGLTSFYPVPLNLVLPHNFNNISIDFAASEPALPRQVRYQYKLEGYNEDWSPLNNSSTAVFGNISAGKYVFKLKAISPFGQASEMTYSFRVLPPWWLTWWTYTFYVLIGGGILYGFYRTRIRIIENNQARQINIMVATQEDERKRISRDLHDGVGIKLSALKLFLSSLYEKSSDAGNHEISILAQGSDGLISEVMQDVRQLLRNLSPMVLDEFGYTAAVEGLVNKINETNQLRFNLVVFGMHRRLEKNYELALYRITQELINNILKHAEAKEVSLQIGLRDEKIILMIEDDGKGFDVSSHKDGYGLHNLDARTKLMKGKMTIDSQLHKGTTVLIEIPYHNN